MEDRLRGIKKDIRVMGAASRDSVTMLEQIARFYIITSHMLCHKQQLNSMEGFIDQQNNGQLVDTMSMLEEHWQRNQGKLECLFASDSRVALHQH